MISLLYVVLIYLLSVEGIFVPLRFIFQPFTTCPELFTSNNQLSVKSLQESLGDVSYGPCPLAHFSLIVKSRCTSRQPIYS